MSSSPSIFDNLAALDEIAARGESKTPVPLPANRDRQRSQDGSSRRPLRASEPAAPLASTSTSSPAKGDEAIVAMLAELKADILALRREQEASEAARTQDQHLYDMLAELRDDIESLKEHERAHAPGPARKVEPTTQNGATQAPGESDLRAMLADLKRDIHEMQEHSARAVPRQPNTFAPAFDAARLAPAGRAGAREVVGGGASDSNRIATFGSLAATLLLALILGWAALKEPRDSASTLRTIETASGSSQRPSALAQAPVGGVLYEALATGVRSPRGEDASRLTAADVMAKVDAERRASRDGRMGAEGEYWLKRYVTTALGDQSTPKALTQLGAFYADGPEFADGIATARELWEIASALGDPVAMCFLGQVYEAGLGVATDQVMALAWYERAQAAGGCTDVQGAIARLR